MPALLLHMTIAKEAAADPTRPALLAEVSDEVPALLLGSILPDLPYHATFVRQVVRHLLRKSYLPSEWGDLLHTRGTATLALSILEYARRGPVDRAARRKAVALGVGYLCHCALDTIVHPEINRVVARIGASANRPTDSLHAQVERYQSLFFHHQRLHFDIAGSPYPADLVSQMAGAGMFRPQLEPALQQAYRAALLQTHSRAPSRRELSDWLWGVTSYARLMSSPLGKKVEGLHGDIDALREQHYRGPHIDLETPLERARALTFDYWRAAEQLMGADRVDTDVRGVFLRQVPNVDLNTGA